MRDSIFELSSIYMMRDVCLRDWSSRQDIRALDGTISNSPIFLLQSMFENLVAVLGVMIFIAVIIPWFLLVLPPFVLAFYYCQQKYVAVSRELRRLDGISRSPTYAHFSQTLQVRFKRVPPVIIFCSNYLVLRFYNLCALISLYM